jgi:hypothetical protein
MAKKKNTSQPSEEPSAPAANLVSPALPMSKPEMRAREFWGQRMAGWADPDAAVRRSSALPGEEAASVAEQEAASVQSFVQHRLEQLRQYRAKRAEAAESAASKRGAAVPGQYNWVPLGPSGTRLGQAEGEPLISGRTRGIAIAPGGNRIYIATANGGVWRSENAGETWQSLMDGWDLNDTPGSPAVAFDSDSLACGAIALVPGVEGGLDRLYVGSGEGLMGNVTAGDSKYNGVGPIISRDSGRTWQTETSSPSLAGNAFFQLAVDPSDHNHVIGATSGGLYRRDPVSGSWSSVPLSPPSGFAALWPTAVVVARQGTRPVFFAAGWFVNSGRYRGRIFKSDDGQTWTALDNGFTASDRCGRIALACLPDNPSVLYAQVAYYLDPPSGSSERKHGRMMGVFRWSSAENRWREATLNSTDLIELFGRDPDKNGQGNYDNSIVMVPHPTDSQKEMLIVGGSAVASTYAAISRVEITLRRDPDGKLEEVKADGTPIGEAVHADVHALVCPPNNYDRLWVGCDGGVFSASEPRRAAPRFRHRNSGLQTMSMLHMSAHPTEPGVMFCGTQDNGGQRFTGDPTWYISSGGDCGYCVVHRQTPAQVLTTYVENNVFFFSDGGRRRTTLSGMRSVNTLDTANNEAVAFYAPLVGSPKRYNTANKRWEDHADCPPDLVAFGAERLHVSDNFAANWQAVPAAMTRAAADPKDSTIHSIAIFSSKKIYAGTLDGQVFRYTRNNAGVWAARTQLKQFEFPPGGPNARKPVISAIVSDPLDNAAGDKFYVALGGAIGSTERVWHFDGANWTAVTHADANKQLLDLHHSALAVQVVVEGADLKKVLYVGADVGVWRFADAANGWVPFSEGLPDAAVVDLQILPEALPTRPALLRAATHGRGVFQRDLSTVLRSAVELFVRSTPLDQGWDAVDLSGKADPNDPTVVAQNISAIQSPDIKVDVPNGDGHYQFPFESPGETIHFSQFADRFEDKSQHVAAHDNTAVVTSRIHVQVHNRGAFAANNVQVSLLMASAATPAPPNLPANHAAELNAGRPVNTGGWTTIGITRLDDVRAGFPRVAVFNLTSDKLPAPAVLTAANRDFYLYALVHHAGDTYAPAAEVNAQTIAVNQAKVTYKKIRAEAFTGTLPAEAKADPLPGFVAIPDTATAPGAPFDSMLGFALAQNDLTLDQLLDRARHSPMAGTASAEHIFTAAQPPQPKTMLRAKTIRLDTELTAHDQTPVVWFASEKITLNARINANGKGSDGEGDFGGSGGFGNANGNPCRLPGSRIVLAAGGVAADKNGKTPAADWFSRALLMFQHLKGGAAGGSSGGRGGGVVCLCAPVIEFTASGRIEASGAAPPVGPANAGGGGGGLIILIANEFVNVNEAAAHPQRNVVATGGAALLTGGTGGAGIIIKKQIG